MALDVMSSLFFLFFLSFAPSGQTPPFYVNPSIYACYWFALYMLCEEYSIQAGICGSTPLFVGRLELAGFS